MLATTCDFMINFLIIVFLKLIVDYLFCVFILFFLWETPL